MAENEALVENPEGGKISKITFTIVWMLVATYISVKAYENWKLFNEPVPGIGVSYEEVVLESLLVVVEVHKDTPAFRSGLLKGDVIVEVNGRKIKRASEFRNTIKELTPGEKVTLTVVRGGQRIAVVSEVAALKRKDYK
jgi:S1-C subfamily serine protease